MRAVVNLVSLQARYFNFNSISRLHGENLLGYVSMVGLISISLSFRTIIMSGNNQSTTDSASTVTPPATVAAPSAIFDNLVRQVSEAIKPGLVEACISAASTISESTQKEFSQLASMQQERRDRDAALVELMNPGNREQFAHASNVLAEFENIELALDNSKVDVARTAIKKGKEILKERLGLIRLAEHKDWRTVREYSASNRLSLSEEEDRRWRRAIKSVETKSKDSGSVPRVSPYSTRSTRSSRKTSATGSYVPNVDCWGCGEHGHVLMTCPKARAVQAGSDSRMLVKANPSSASNNNEDDEQ